MLKNVNGTNSVAWTNTDGTLSPWTLNSNWQHTGSTLYPPGSSGYYQTEVDFNQDFDGGGKRLGPPAPSLSYTEQIGNTWLAKDSDGNGYAQPNGSSQQIRNHTQRTARW